MSDYEDEYDDDPARMAAERLAEYFLDDPRVGSVLGQVQQGLDQFQNFIDRLGNIVEHGSRKPRRPSPSQRYYPRPRTYPPEDPRHPRQQLARRILELPLQGGLSKTEITKKRRELAGKYHPDRGGNPEAMLKVNQAADYLLRVYPR